MQGPIYIYIYIYIDIKQHRGSYMPSGKRTFLGNPHRGPEHPIFNFELSDGLDMGNVWLKTSDSNR